MEFRPAGRLYFCIQSRQFDLFRLFSQSRELGIGREFDQSVDHERGRFLVIVDTQSLIDLADPAGLGIDSNLLLAALAQAIDFNIQPWILRINASQGLPMPVRIRELPELFSVPSPFDDRFDEVAS